jgi:GDP-L-fucose synthase
VGPSTCRSIGRHRWQRWTLRTYPVDFLSENLRIQSNVLDAALAHNVERVLFLGSSCIYPKFAEQPIREDSLLTGHLEPNDTADACLHLMEHYDGAETRKDHPPPRI